MERVHPSLAADWKQNFKDNAVTELMLIEGGSIDLEMAEAYVQALLVSYDRLLKDISGE